MACMTYKYVSIAALFQLSPLYFSDDIPLGWNERPFTNMGQNNSQKNDCVALNVEVRNFNLY